MTVIVDNSILQSVAACDTQALMSYVWHLRRKDEEKVEAECGKGLHVALAYYFAGYNAQDAAEKFVEYYKPISEATIASDHRCHWETVRQIFLHWAERRPVSVFPFEPVKDRIEQGVSMPLDENGDFVLFALIDLPAVDKALGVHTLADHKTTGKVSQWWVKKWRLNSQLVGYMEAEAYASGVEVPYCYLNVIELPNLPKSAGKCRVHAVPYVQCRLEHANHQLIQVQRNPGLAAQWRIDALYLAQRFKWLKEEFPTPEYVQYAQQQGIFNNGCTFCPFRDFCASGRDVRLVEAMFEKHEWKPWEGKR